MKTLLRKFQSILLITSSISLSSTAFSANLLETYQLATQNDPNWAAKKAKFLGDRETVTMAYGALLPNISISAQYGQLDYDGQSTPDFEKNTNECIDISETIEQSGEEATLTDFIPCLRDFFSSDQSLVSTTHESYNFRIIQPLFRADRWYKYKGAQSIEQSQEAELALAQQDLILNVAEAYFGVLRAQEEYRLRTIEQKSLLTQLDEIKNRYRLGLARDTDLFEVQGTYDLAKAAETVAQVALENIKEDLALLTGQNSVSVSPLPHNIPIDAPNPLRRQDWEDFSQRNNYQVIAARFAVEAATRQIKEKRSGHAPTLDFLLDFKDSKGASGFSTDTTTTSVGIQLAIPLFAGGIVSAQEKQARYKEEEAKHNLKLATRNAARQTRQNYNKVMSSVSTFEARKRAVRANNSAFRAIKGGYKSGLRSLSDVLSSQKKVFTAKKELTTARFDYITNTLKLKKTSGILSPKDLEILNGWLNVSANNTASANESYDLENETLTVDEIDGIQLRRENKLRSFEDEKTKEKKNQSRSLFDAYKAWQENKTE